MKFIVFGEDWGRHPSSTQHLFKHISSNHEVIWVNSIGMRSPSFSVKDIKRAAEKLMSKLGFVKPKTATTNEPNNITIVEPKVLPWHNLKWVQTINRFMLNRQLRKYREDNADTCFWISVPTAEYLVDANGAKTVYYIGDDFSGLAGVDYNLVKPFEERLLNNADVTFVCSQALLEKFKSHKPILLSHGVDLDLFSKGCFDNFIAYSKPVIGFYGSLNAWLDIDLIKLIATSKPNIQIELIGKVETSLGDLLSLENVRHIPAVAHHELPKYVQSWNVAILPFKDSPQIRACNPLKLREYLASGTPVVSTRYNAVEQYSEQVFIADDHDTFVRHIEHACYLKEVVRGWISWQQSVVTQESWQVRAEQVMAHLSE